ncbi:hypothetical protein HDU97_006385 [Phlyctochytrium planicorne]|nr:hypothetical protein HDU97_006385 [Phlyctochytrium planicorne]
MPGTILELDQNKVIVDRFLAEGGFAHVYVVRNATTMERAVLKRTACPDKESVGLLLNEINIMKSLVGHKSIVEYFDSSITKSRHGGFEVFILMEFCPGGHLVDFMNTKLQQRLKEHEILAIFSDICEAVAYMHYMEDPILHRDIKVENVLIANDGTFKLCDFGSGTLRKVQPNASLSAAEIRQLEDEVEKMTTLQYRAPELCDLYQRKGVTEKALGTTPFEESGKLAILNGRYVIPPTPVYSRDMIKLIESMLEVEPRKRWNIYEVFSKVCSMRGVRCPLINIYQEKIETKAAVIPQQIPKEPEAPNTASTPSIPTITPMRRGRPTPKQSSQTNSLVALNSSGNLTVDSSSSQPKLEAKLEQMQLKSDDDDPFMAVARTKSIPNLRADQLGSQGSITLSLRAGSSSSLNSGHLASPVLSSVPRNPAATRPKSEGSTLDTMWAFANEDSFKEPSPTGPPKPARRRPPPPPPPASKRKSLQENAFPEGVDFSAAGYAPLADDSGGPEDASDPFLVIAKKQ